MERSEFNNHVSEQLNRDLEALFNQVLEMGGLVEQQVDQLYNSLETNNIDLAKSTIKLDKIVNREEIEIDRLAGIVLARQQPTASDLRLLVMAIRMASDLERMGDEATKISKLILNQCKLGNSCSELVAFDDLRQIVLAAENMIKMALNAFSKLDSSDFMEIYHLEDRMDEVLDSAQFKIKAALVSTTDEATVDTLLRTLKAVRAAERITDHALNMGESIVYLVHGKDVRSMDKHALEDYIARKNA
jgi:phosphate transport system protein